MNFKLIGGQYRYRSQRSYETIQSIRNLINKNFTSEIIALENIGTCDQILVDTNNKKGSQKSFYDQNPKKLQVA